MEAKKKIRNRDDEIKETISKLSNFSYGKKFINKKRKEKKKQRKQLQDPIADALSIINYEKYTKFDDIKSALQSRMPSMGTKENVEFVQQLLASKIFNVNININDILGGRCFNMYMGKFGYVDNEGYIFTSDNLYWIANLYELLKKKEENEKKIKKEEEEEEEVVEDNSLSLKNLVNMKERYINIQAINSDNSNYRKGYINDHNKDFSIIGFESFSQEDQNKIKEGKIPDGSTGGSFGIKGVKYNYYIYPKGECIVVKAPDEAKKETLQALIASYMKEYGVINSKKIKPDSYGIKLFSVDDGKNIYISQKVKLTDYWPCQIIFANPLSYSFLYKFDIDMIRYEQYILKNYATSAQNGEFDLQKFFVFDNIIDFSNFNLMINFLTVEILANYEQNKYKDLHAKYADFISEWKKYKTTFNVVKRNLSFFLKLFDTFFCSFRDKISYGVFARIDKIMNKRLSEFESSFNKISEEDGNVYDMFGKFLLNNKLDRVACTIFNACTEADNLLGLAKNIAELASKVKGLNAKDLFSRMQEIGAAIYGMYINQKDDVSHLINEIRSPSLYLGDIIFGNSAVAKGIMDKFSENVGEEVEISKNNASDLIKMNQLQPADAGKLAIGKYFESKGLKNVYRQSGTNVNFVGPYAEWYKSLGKELGKGARKFSADVETLGRTMYVGSDFEKAWNILPTCEKELNLLYEGYKKYTDSEKKREDAKESEKATDKINEEIKENINKIEEKEKKEKTDDNDENDEKDVEETASTKVENEEDLSKLKGKEKENYLKLLDSGYNKDEILGLIENNEKLLNNDSDIVTLVNAKKIASKSTKSKKKK